MAGGFYCPYCKTRNACNCGTCRQHIKEGDYVNVWTEDGENHICGKCSKIYSPDQSLDMEYKILSDLNRKPVPQIGKIYNCFDDGKITPSRLYTVEVTEVIKSEEIDVETLEFWREEVNECKWLYASETDFFIKTKENKEVFVRTLDGGWFGVGNYMDGGRLDIDGELTKIIIDNSNETN